MIDSVNAYAVSALLGVDHKIVYIIPPYQREYTWQKAHWEELIDDILSAPEGYFLGSIICINQQKDAASVAHLELVDGQQRMTTLSILLAALYASLSEHREDFDDEDHATLINLKRKLVLREPDGYPRLTPQLQNNNHDDYLAVLAEAGLLKTKRTKPAYLGHRKVMRAFKYFREQISRRLTLGEPAHIQLLRMIELVSAAVLVKIEVKTHSDAYVLFESLNNRGAQLTPIDLIKNKLLATTHGKDKEAVAEVFEAWREVIELLGDDYAMQERFFRQYYNAFKEELSPIINEPVATKSNLIKIYEKLIEQGHQEFVEKLGAAAGLYSQIAGGQQAAEDPKLRSAFLRLQRAQGAPSYLLMLYLMTRAQEHNLSNTTLADACHLLVAFFVRRNMTGLPATYELQRLFMSITAELYAGVDRPVLELLRERLKSISSSDELFRERLSGNVYDESYAMTRFILSSLAESAMTDETRVDLWATQDKKSLWSVEHIFPQGGNIPESWIESMGGSPETARATQAELVHTIGNLSITRFNSTLSNKGFVDKLSAVDANGNPVGIKNGLSINADVVAASEWTRQHILDRRDKLVEQAMQHFQIS
ncbi:DUF262 domain-containing protein [Arthrobacter bambusae]